MKKKMLYEYTLKELLFEEEEKPQRTGYKPRKGTSIQFDLDELFGGNMTGMTIGQMKNMMKEIEGIKKSDARSGDAAAVEKLIKLAGDFAVDELVAPKKWYNLFSQMFEISKEAYSGVDSSAYKGYTIDDYPDKGVATLWRNFPIIDMFDLNPVYFSVLDDHVLGGLQDRYLEYLMGLSDETLVGDVQNIDVFAENFVEDQHRVKIDALQIQKPKTLET